MYILAEVLMRKMNVSMADVAKSMQVSQATVSRALRNHASISEATRKAIRAEAKRMGYFPNPLVSALMASRRRREPAEDIQITYVEADRTGSGRLRSGLLYRKLYAGISKRASELGYRLDRLDAFAPGVSMKRVRSILTARGIDNVIVSPLFGEGQDLDLGFGRLRAVAIGLSLVQPALHRIRANHYANAETVLHHVIKNGYHRIGFVHDRSGSNRLGNRWLAAYLASSTMQPSIFHAPPLLTASASDALEPKLKRYVEKHRLDVLITPDHKRVLPALEASRLRVPGDLALASVNACGGDQALAGINEDHERQGMEAVNLLVGEILHGQFGIPKVQREVVVPGHWVPGKTLPLRSKGRSPA